MRIWGLDGKFRSFLTENSSQRTTPSAIPYSAEQLDGRAFLNDPDVFLLRDENIHCTFEQRKIIATVNKVFGSVLFTSDNVGKYSDEQMSVLLDTFKKSKIDVKSAEFLNENKRIMKFVYTQDGIEHTFKFNIDKGTIV